MKIFGKPLISPVFIHRTSTHYGDKPDLSFRWRNSSSAGTTAVHAFTFEISTPKNKWQMTFCWRPEVTMYNWNEKRFCKKTKIKA